MDKEILEKILHSHKSIENIKWINPDKVSGFSRTISFDIRGQHYEIVWFCNCSDLKCGEMQICSFETIGIDGCYPNSFKRNLNFGLKDNSFSGIRTIAIIPLEEYEN